MSSPAPSSTNWSILLVDDQEPLLEATEMLLRSLGHSVDATTDTNQALQLFREQPGRFDIVVTDQTMPQMRGTELSSLLTGIRPEVPVVLMTGYSEDIEPDTLAAAGIREVCRKPFEIEELIAAMLRALSS